MGRGEGEGGVGGGGVENVAGLPLMLITRRRADADDAVIPINFLGGMNFLGFKLSLHRKSG